MRKSELIAVLQSQCWKVFGFATTTDESGKDVSVVVSDPMLAQPFGSAAGIASEYKLGTVQMAPRGTRKVQNIHMVVTDEGEANESATLVGSPIDLPVGDTLTAIVYLEQRKAAGDWAWYEYESGRSDLGWFTIRAGVTNQDGTESEKRYRVFTDSEGNADHAEIV
jgi:hypothetical protein